MPITIELNQKHLSPEEPLKVHYLPAQIDGDGEANVDQYFNNYTKLEDGHLTNALRGFPLQGQELEVPPGYKALVLQETREPLAEDADRRLRITGSFDKFTYWNYDKIPSQADGYTQALQVLKAANQLAKPISAEEVAKEIEAHNQKK